MRGFHFYAKATSVAMPMFYRLVECHINQDSAMLVMMKRLLVVTAGIAPARWWTNHFDEKIKLGGL
ncbi:hypothetical protein O9992_30670 [Vibrio lentus]|nr:hypothetical protein [Vibrio lentus]